MSRFHFDVEPRVVSTWDQFIVEKEPYSIALDGRVKGKTIYNNHFVNINHHEGVDRLSTRSTCGQAYIDIKQRFGDRYLKHDSPVNICVNDCDQDTGLASWLIINHERLEGNKSEPLINRLVSVIDLLDVTAGTYPFDLQASTMRKIAWVFEPYTDARMSGRLPKMDAGGMRDVLEVTHKRISEHVLGDGDEISPKDMENGSKYEVIGGGPDWKLVNESGFYARSKMSFDNIESFVSARKNGNDRYVYSIGKISPFVEFPIKTLYGLLNNAEGIEQENIDCWGGSDTIGGSPRIAGSRLTPKELESIINDFLSKN